MPDFALIFVNFAAKSSILGLARALTASKISNFSVLRGLRGVRGRFSPLRGGNLAYFWLMSIVSRANLRLSVGGVLKFVKIMD